ncbi:MAG: DUF1922 domain-containing protein [Candidatus Freyarchaeota archaeon]
MKAGYAVFKCPKCGRYTFAPASSKSRLCSNCGKIIKVDLSRAEIVGDARRASELVRYRNAKEAPPNVKQAIRMKGEDARLPPREGVRSSSLLLKMLAERCSDTPISLDVLDSLCKEYDLDPGWVREKLPELGVKGIVFFPTPWTLKFIDRKRKPEVKSRKMGNIYKVVLDALSRSSLSESEIVELLAEQGFSPQQVEEAIEALHNRGLIIEVKPGFFKKAPP